jgi:hypothetical protein
MIPPAARHVALAPARCHRPSVALVAVPLLAALALAGCSPQSHVLARVGKRVVTVADFGAAAHGNWMQYAPPPDAAKHQLLGDLVKRELLLSIADANGLMRDSLLSSQRRMVADQVLARAIGDLFTPPVVPVSEAEVMAFYDWSRTLAHVHLIYTSSASQAAAAAEHLRAGVPFAQVADHVTPPGLLPPGGDIGERSPGALVEPLDAYCMQAPVGAILGPVPAMGDGWFVAMVSSRRRVEPHSSFEAARPMLEDMVRQRKQRMVAVRWSEELRRRFGVTPEIGGSQELFQLLYRRSGPDSTSAISAEERRHVLARYVDERGKKQVYTVDDAFADLAVPDRETPAPSQLPAIESWLGQQLIRRIALCEARRRGLDRDPAVARGIEDQVNGRILETVYGLYVVDASSVTDDQVMAEFQRESAQFQRIVSATVLTLVMPDSAAAQALIAHGAHGGTLRDVARMAGLENRVGEEHIAFPNRDALWTAMQPNFQMMARGEWAGPVHARNGWMLIQLEDKAMSPQPFEQLSDAAKQSLRQAALARVRDARLEAVTDSVRRVTRPFELHEDALKSLPWPPPGVLNTRAN